MDKVKRNKLMWRWSLVSAGLIGAFWFVYYLITGEMPVVSSIKMTENWVVELPFGIPRWADMFLGPLFACVIIPLYFFIKDDEDLADGLVAGVVAGLGVGLLTILGFGLATGLGVGLVVGLVFGLGVGLVWVLKTFFSARMWREIGGWLAGK